MQVLKLVNDTLINFVEACDSRGVARRADQSSIASSHEHCHDIVSALYVINSSRRN